MTTFNSLFRRQTDLLAAIGITIALNITVFVPGIRDTPLRIPLGLLFVCFVPGYVLVAALYPERSRMTGNSDDSDSANSNRRLGTNRGLSGLERFVLAVGLSITVIPLVGYLFNFTRWGVRLVPILLSVSAVTILAALVAAIRRQQLPEDDRFRVIVPEWMAIDSSRWLVHRSPTEVAINAMLIASLLFVLVSVGYAVTTSSPGGQYSELYLLTEEDGNLVDEAYSDEFQMGDEREIAFGVENHEQRTANYTVVVVEQHIETDEDEPIVRDQRELDRFEATLEHNDTWHHEHELEPTMSASPDRVRVAWLLYVDDVPSQPSIENADYHVHLVVSANETTSVNPLI